MVGKTALSIPFKKLTLRLRARSWSLDILATKACFGSAVARHRFSPRGLTRGIVKPTPKKAASSRSTPKNVQTPGACFQARSDRLAQLVGHKARAAVVCFHEIDSLTFKDARLSSLHDSLQCPIIKLYKIF